MGARRGLLDSLLLRSVLGTLALTLLVGSLAQTYYRNSPSRWSSFLVGDPPRGAVLFFETKGCAHCHSASGVGGHSAPDLGFNRSPKSSITETVSALWNHAPSMWEAMRTEKIASPDLDRADMANLLAFLYTARYVDEPGDESRGAKLFVAKGCARCHSPEGAAAQIAPDLTTITGIDTPIAWAQTMWNHAPKMETRMQEQGTSWPRFEGGEMNDLLAYVRAICGGSRHESELLPASPERGSKVFHEKACIVCHSVQGKGGTVGPDLGGLRTTSTSIVRFAGAMWNHSPEMWRASQARNIPRPVFDGRQLADLVAFLASVRYFEPTGSAQTGGRLFVERGCASCHGSNGEGTRHGPALRGRGRGFTIVSLATALWKDGPRMYRRTRELNLPWPHLTESDIGSLVSFLNTPPD